MEGTSSTVDEVLTPDDDADEERSNRAAAIGYAIALTNGFEEVTRDGPDAINVPLMSQLHVGAMARDPNYGGEPGALRHPEGPNGGIVINGGLGDRTRSVFNPAPARHITRCLGAVANWMSNDLVIQRGDAGQGIPLPARMAIGHAHFEAVHPFYDGNGRVGRQSTFLCDRRSLPLASWRRKWPFPFKPRTGRSGIFATRESSWNAPSVGVAESLLLKKSSVYCRDRLAKTPRTRLPPLDGR